MRRRGSNLKNRYSTSTIKRAFVNLIDYFEKAKTEETNYGNSGIFRQSVEQWSKRNKI